MTTKEKAEIIHRQANPCPVTIPIQQEGGQLQCCRGFTLVELIVVSAILAVLALLALPAYSKIKDKAREVRCMTEVRELEKAISSIVIDRGGTYPADWAGLGITVPKDPWGRDYVYSLPVRGVFGPDTINGDFDLYSKGADGLSEDDIDDPTSQDDVVRAGDGGFVGLVSNFLP